MRVLYVCYIPVQINGNHDDDDEQEVEKKAPFKHRANERKGRWREVDEPLRITKQNAQICMYIYMIYLRLPLVYV